MKKTYFHSLNKKEKELLGEYWRMKGNPKELDRIKGRRGDYVRYENFHDYYQTLPGRVQEVIDRAEKTASRRRRKGLPTAGNSETIMRNRVVRHLNMTGELTNNRYQYGGNR